MLEKLTIPCAAPGRIWLCRHPAAMPSSHRHAELEFNLVLNGHAGYLCGRQRYEIGPRSLVLLFPGQEHHLIHAAPNFRMWIMVIRRRYLRQLLAPGHLLLERNPAGDYCRTLRAEDATFLEALAERMAGKEIGPALRVGLGCFLHEAWRAFGQAAPEQECTDLHPAVENALRILRERDADGDLEAIGAEAGLSRSHLSRLFHRQTGITLTRYRNQLRLEKFWRIYGNGERTNLLAAALLAGFGSYSQFYRIFRSFGGLSPQEARRALSRELE